MRVVRLAEALPESLQRKGGNIGRRQYIGGQKIHGITFYTTVADRQIIGRSYRNLDAGIVRDDPIERIPEDIEFLPFEEVQGCDFIL